MPIDPICGMTVEPKTAAGQAEYHGQIYYFCAPSCLQRFQADPAAALRSKSSFPSMRKPLPMMMPQQGLDSGKAIDPVCGMAIDPKTAAGSLEHRGQTYYFCATSCM